MTITTLLAYWSDQKNQADKELSGARVALTAAQNELATQRAKLAKANQELADLVTETKKIRADLAEAATPADVDALESRLAKAIINTRAKQAEIIGIEAGVDSAQTTLNLATAEVNAATTRASSITAALETADQDNDRVKVGANQAVRASNSVIISNLTGHPFIVNDAITVMGMTDSSFDGAFTISAVTDTSITYSHTAANATSGGGVVFGKRALRLRHKLTDPPLSALVADATAALTAKPWTDAKARIEADLPQELRDCANERAKVELKGLDNEQKIIDEIDNLLGPVIDQTENLREVFINADAEFRDYVVNAKRRFDQALAIAVRIADSKQNPLTEAENLSIHSREPDGTIDAALQTKRNDAAAKSLAIASAQIDVDAKQTAVNIAILKAKAADIDEDPNTDTDVIAANGALTIVQGNLAGAVNAFTSAMQTDLTDWETAVPDTAWRNLADFKEARRLFTALKIPPTALVTAMDAAEADLVDALLAADNARRTLKFLGSEAQKAASKLSFDTGILPRRVLGALRGDS